MTPDEIGRAEPTSDDIQWAAELLRKGSLVGLPTETVYGLGANALDPQAVASIFEAKQRPAFDPLIVHLSSAESIDDYAAEVPPRARDLAMEFWPGPLTIVFEKQPNIPDIVTSGLSTVALRVPGSDVTRRVIDAAGVPVAAPSANIFGRVSPTTAAHVREQLEGRVEFVLDDGPCAVGIESTVVRVVDDQVWLLRPGGTPIEDLERVVGKVHIADGTPHTAPTSPGQLEAHYAPLTPLFIVPDCALTSRALSKRALSGRIGLIAFGEVEEPERYAKVWQLSSERRLREAAANFFAALRELDALQLDGIVCAPFPDEGLGRALNDRLIRATASR